MTSTSNLFSHTLLKNHLAEQLSYVPNRIGQIKSLENWEHSVEATKNAGQVKPARLLREDAEFRVAPSDSGYSATMRIPIEGEARMLHHPTTHVEQRKAPYASLSDGYAMDREKYVELNRGFKGTADEDEIRTWAREQADFIEGVLAAQQPLIEAHNNEAAQLVERLLAERKATLESVAKMGDGLTRGI